MTNKHFFSWFQLYKQYILIMFKKYSKISALILFSILNIFVTTASAIELDEATRTVIIDGSGKTAVLTPEQVKRGKR